MSRIILASKSPRRIEMLEKAGYDIDVRPASVRENIPFEMSPEPATMYLAFIKAAAVYEDMCPDSSLPVLAADTVVVHHGKILGKPADSTRAFETLYSMRNDVHHVITGCCIIKDGIRRCFCDKTAVYFGDYSRRELEDYVATSEPYDKAGGYAIQGTFGRYVTRIEGDMNNVIGLPLHLAKKYL